MQILKMFGQWLQQIFKAGGEINATLTKLSL